MAQNFFLLFLNFHNIKDTLLWPVTMLAITEENKPNAFLIIFEIEKLFQCYM